MKRLTLLLLVTVLMTALAACSNGNSGTSNGSATTPAETNQPSDGNSTAAPVETEAPKPVEVEVFKVGSGATLPEEDFVKDEILKATNVNMNLSLPANKDDMKNQLNTRVAAANFPDVMELPDKSMFEQYEDSNLLLDLTPYLDQLSNAIAFVGENNVKKGTIDGKVYAIVKEPNPTASNFWVRKDWLDHLKLEVPTTAEQLLQTAIAFREDDPDGNGKKDTYGVSGIGGAGVVGNFQGIFSAFGSTGAWNTFSIENNQLINGLYDSRTKDALEFVKKFFDAGVVDPDLLVNKNYDRIYQGFSGIVFTDWSQMAKDDKITAMKSANPNAEWVQLGALKGPDGTQFAGNNDIGRTSGYVTLPKSLEKNPEKLEAVLKLINYIGSDEGLRLVQFGIEDRHYTLDGDKVVATELMGKEAGYVWPYQIIGRPELTYLKVKFAKQGAEIDTGINQPRIEIYNSFISIPEGFSGVDADKFAQEEVTKFVYGKRPLGEYDDFLKTLDETFKNHMLVDAAEAQLKELGYLK
ncbi:ABC transporter substrate-binding protein [Paenibacillus sp. J5C_2022]|uniref:ABC transporter substrate-binding protein n=1 Tax=Paenibacillus sp. J5C2022 TaxID=2977129 RepID=UPI0021CEE04D|nr:ABC transporter substrate-binding protein [Paenibacillus sp. J5C2022]MCU6708883.1 ABC transporter substrate-binding protein [Paenibacillus sp. J5C2022]